MARSQRSASVTSVRAAKSSIALEGARGLGKQVYGMILLSTAVVLLGALLYLWPQMRMVELGYQQSALRAQQAKALQHQKQLQVEIASLRGMARIERIAVEKLGLRPPRISQVIYLRQKQQTVSARRAP